MKMTKALALLLAIAMVVVCFNLPAICDPVSGDDGDEDPWDNELITNGERLEAAPVDTAIIIDDPTNGAGDDLVDPELILQLQFIINLRIIPNFNLIIVNN